MDCPHCGEPLVRGTLYCQNCGKRVQSNTAPASTGWTASANSSFSTSATPQTNYAGQKWEYLTATYEAYGYGDTRLKKVNQQAPNNRYSGWSLTDYSATLGTEGWEMVNFGCSPLAGNKSFVLAVYKRPR